MIQRNFLLQEYRVSLFYPYYCYKKKLFIVFVMSVLQLDITNCSVY